METDLDEVDPTEGVEPKEFVEGDEVLCEQEEAKLSGETLADLNSIKTAVRCFYDLQKPRVMMVNRMSARKRLREQGKIPAEELGIDARLVKSYALLEEAEKELGKSLIIEAEKAKVWHFWLKHVKGIGSILGACFVGLVGDATKFATISKLRTYAGVGLVQHKVRGEKINWSPLLKTTCWKAANSFIKFKCFYRRFYDSVKAEDKAKHPEPIVVFGEDGKPKRSKKGKIIKLYSKGHIHNRAMRKTAQLFLSHLWQAWYDAEGVPQPTKPYCIEHMEGHTMIPYSEAMEKKKKAKL